MPCAARDGRRDAARPGPTDRNFGVTVDRRREPRSRRPTSSATAPWSCSARPATSSATRSRPRSRATSPRAAASSPSATRSQTEPELAVHDRRARRARQGRAVAARPGDDQGRRPRPRREPARCRSTGATSTATTTTTATSAASRTCWPRSTRRPTAAARWAPTTRSPGARTTRAGARSTPASATRPAATPRTRCEHLAGAIEWAARRRRPRLQRLRRDGAGQLPADEDLGAAEPQRADRLRRAAGRPRAADGARRPAAPARPRQGREKVVLATLPVYTNCEDGLYGPAIDNDFATNKWVYLYYAPPTVRIKQVRRHDGRRDDRRRARRPTAAADPCVWQDTWAGYFQLSRFKFVDGANPTLDLASEQKIMQVSNDRGACCHVARRHRLRQAQQPVARHGRRHAVGRRQLGRLLAAQRPEDRRDADRARQRRSAAVHADVRRPDDGADRRTDATADADQGGARGAVEHRARRRDRHRRPVDAATRPCSSTAPTPRSGVPATERRRGRRDDRHHAGGRLVQRAVRRRPPQRR